MSDQTVKKWSPNDLSEAVANQVKHIFVQLVPEDVWKQMCEKLVNEFTETPYNGDRSPLEKLVKAELESVVKERVCKDIKAYFDGPEFNAIYNTNLGNYKSSQPIETIIKSLVPELVATMFTNVTQQIVSMIRQDLQKRPY